jgi:hypothetical protein
MTLKEFSADNLPIVGQTVIDEDGNIGTVVEVNDIHNIRIEYYQGSFGLYCLDPECLVEYSPLYAK